MVKENIRTPIILAGDTVYSSEFDTNGKPFYIKLEYAISSNMTIYLETNTDNSEWDKVSGSDITVNSDDTSISIREVNGFPANVMLRLAFEGGTGTINKLNIRA